jgi:hypothetical protein
VHPPFDLDRRGHSATTPEVIQEFARKPWYRHRVNIPGSIVIALAGLYWTVERVVT